MGFEDRQQGQLEGQNQQSGATESPFNPVELFRDGPLAAWRTRDNSNSNTGANNNGADEWQPVPRRLPVGPETPSTDNNFPRPMPSVRVEAQPTPTPAGDNNFPRPMPSVRVEPQPTPALPNPDTTTPRRMPAVDSTPIIVAPDGTTIPRPMPSIRPETPTPTPAPPRRDVTSPRSQTQEPPLANPTRPTDRTPPAKPTDLVRPAEQVITRLGQSDDPVRDVSVALDKINGLKFASVTRLDNGWHHVQGNLEATQVSQPPRVRGLFRPVESRVESDFSFNLRHTQNGLKLENMTGFTGNARGPLGKLRETETTSMTLGRDRHGPFLRAESQVHFRRGAIGGGHTLREADFPAGSPLRTVMNQPEAMKNITSALSLFQSTDDLDKVSIKKVSQSSFDVAAEAQHEKHIEINQRLESGALVKSIDLERALTARITAERDSVGLQNIKGMKVNVELGPLKMTLEPTKVALARSADGKPVVKIELRTPQGAVLPLEVPMEKLIANRNRR